ncbi:MAG: restriction endonuclease subunit R, partial [Candidatus Odinarchaeota archaeon]
MNQYSKIDKVKLFRNLFKGREDVFAIYWQKGKKKGYMPAYQYDPYMYRLHAYKGGSFKDYKDKTLLPLTDHQVIKHLTGDHLIGIYPLLTDNSSWLIAADFDGEKWADDCLNFINICKEKKIPAYLERSRSGKGGHVWIFFDHPYPAFRSRRIINALLKQAGIISVFDKRSSFDRLFPNQDYHTGKGLGNLIALPLHKPALEQGNCCFIDEQLRPYTDQWDFLLSVQRVRNSHLDKIYGTLQGRKVPAIVPPKYHSQKLKIILDHSVHLNRTGITPGLIDFLKENLNLSNTEYFIKKKTGKSTWGTKQYFKLIEENENEIIIPRG